jgi:prepilin peptidase CpaA
MAILHIVAILGVGLAACATDITTRRIPNVLTFGAAVAAIACQAITGGWEGTQSAMLGWLVGFAAFMPFFLLGGMGAGDVKLLAALGAWTGPAGALWLAIYASLAGGVIAVCVAMASGYLGTALGNVRNLLTFWALVGPRPLPALTLDRGTGPRLAYAVPIFVGALVMLWLE